MQLIGAGFLYAKNFLRCENFRKKFFAGVTISAKSFQQCDNFRKKCFSGVLQFPIKYDFASHCFFVVISLTLEMFIQ